MLCRHDRLRALATLRRGPADRRRKGLSSFSSKRRPVLYLMIGPRPDNPKSVPSFGPRRCRSGLGVERRLGKAQVGGSIPPCGSLRPVLLLERSRYTESLQARGDASAAIQILPPRFRGRSARRLVPIPSYCSTSLAKFSSD